MLLKPLITEKSIKETVYDRFTFLVNPNATKGQIKKAVEDAFKVNVVSIRTTTKPALTTRSSKTGRYQTKSQVKKAIVQLKPKQTISYFEIKK